MKSFITDNLRDKVISDSIPVRVCLGDCDVGNVYLSDTLWFTDYFPKELIMAEIVEGYLAFCSGQGMMKEAVISSNEE